MLNSGKWIDLQEGNWHYYFCGFFWLGCKKYDGVEALNLLKDKNAKSLENLLRSADGNFCMLVISNGRVVLAVERFYGAFCNERANIHDVPSIKRLIKRFPALYRFLSTAKSSIRAGDLKAIYEATLWVLWYLGFFRVQKVFTGNNSVVNAMVAIDQLEEIGSNLGDG